MFDILLHVSAPKVKRSRVMVILYVTVIFWVGPCVVHSEMETLYLSRLVWLSLFCRAAKKDIKIELIHKSSKVAWALLYFIILTLQQNLNLSHIWCRLLHNSFTFPFVKLLWNDFYCIKRYTSNDDLTWSFLYDKRKM